MSIPVPQFVMHVPQVLVSTRLHNQIVKECIRAELFTHWRNRIPLHFRQDARMRYGHAPRSSAYNKWKNRKFGSRRDLVKTGATERRMRSERPNITIGGSAEGGKGLGVRGRFSMSFGFDEQVAKHMKKRFAKGIGRRGAESSIRQRTGVNIAQLRKEIQTFTPDEMAAIATSVQLAYTYKVNNDTTPRQRIKV